LTAHRTAHSRFDLVVRRRRLVDALVGASNYIADGRRRIAGAALLLAAALLVASCSDDKPATTGSTMSPDELKKECADPKWKEQNLGIWYSVCRQPLRW